MINEEKVIMMTKLASYEEKDGKKTRKMNQYYLGDYVVIEILKSIVAGTVCFLIVFGFYFFMHFDEFMADIYKIDLISYARNILTYYGITMAVYLVFTFFYAVIKYFVSRGSLNRYYKNLKKLNAYYKEHRN